MNNTEEQHPVFIPRNFIEKGTFMGGMFKIRNAIEGGVLAILITIPVINLPLTLTVRIIILCMTALPAAMISLIGIGGESITAFLMNALRFLKNRRVIYRMDVHPEPKKKYRIKKPRNKEPKTKKRKRHPKQPAESSSEKNCSQMSSEEETKESSAIKKKERRQFDTSTKRGIRKQAREDIRILKYESRQLKKEQTAARKSAKRQAKLEKQQIKQQLSEERKKERTANKASNQPPASGKSKKKKRKEITLEDYLPIDKIANGVIYTTDHRYVKILEIEPINFLLRSAREQQGIIFSFISYLKISPVKLQIKMISKKADINKHLEQSRLEMERESDPNCRQLQKDYIQFVRQLSSREAVSRRFFLIFEYEPFNVNRKVEEKEILAALETAAQTAKTFLYQCGNDVLVHDNEDEFTTDVLYTLLNRTKCTETPLPKRINQVLTRYMESGREQEVDNIHINEFIAPESLDFKHSNYVLVNGIYHSYLLVPCDGYKAKVMPGWLSLLINAGEGIDIDFFLHKQPKDKIQQRLGQQIRINRSKIKDARKTAIVLYDFCMSLGIPITIYGHSTDSKGVALYSYAEFDSLDASDRYRLMDMSARNGNRDGAALRYVAEHLAKRPESQKLLIIISDGQPADCGYSGTEAEADLRGIKNEYRKRGIVIFAAAIGDDKENIRRIYQDGFLDITKLEDLPKNMTQLVKQYLK